MAAFDPNLVVALVAAVLPTVVAAVTKSTASSAVKGWTLAALSALTALVAEVSTVGVNGFDWNTGFSNFLLAIVTAVTVHKGGLTKGLNEKVAEKTGDTGIGTAHPEKEEVGAVLGTPVAPVPATNNVKVVPTTPDDPNACTDPACVPDEELTFFDEENSGEEVK